MEIDEVFQHIGELGAMQARLFLLLTLPSTWTAPHVMVTNFIGTDPGWTCALPRPDSAHNCNVLESPGECSDNGLLSVLVTDPAEKCRHYENGDCVPVFDTEYTSIVTEWELICSRASYPNLSQSGFFLGLMVGAWLFGTLADIYGRKMITFLALFGCVFAGLGYGLSPNFPMFALSRIVFGLMNQAISIVTYALMVELIGSSKRTLVAMLCQLSFPVGVCVMVVLAYFIQSWRTLCVIISISGLAFLLMWKSIPESPRWLLVQGREEEAMAVLARIARGNGRQMTCTKLKRPSSQTTKSGVSATDLFRGSTIRNRTLILLVAWFTNCTVYYGLSLNAGSLGGGRYLSLVLSVLVELPGLYVSYLLLNRIGRKWTHGGLLMLGGICCLLWALGNWAALGESVELFLALLGKCAVAGSFSVIYLYTAELFPTEVRSLGLGVVSVSSRLGGVIAPLILLLASVSLGVPMVVMGCLGLSAGFLTLYLPETLNQPLPETLAELK